MSQQHKVSGRATAIYTDAYGYTNICYHKTAVVQFNADSILLNSGGWYTATTKTRMNQASSQFNLGFRVIQRDFNWFVEYRGETLTYTDGLTLVRSI